MKTQEADQERLQRQIDRMKKESEWQGYKSRLLVEMTHHLGKSKAIGMGELYAIVFGQTWEKRINDTRPLRKLIEEAQWGDEGSRPIIICSCPAGYYLPIGQEAQEYIEKRLVARALKMLKRAARLKNETYFDLVGRLVLE